MKDKVTNAFTAAGIGDTNGLQRLLRGGVDVNAVSDHENTLLMRASAALRGQTVSLLLKSGADISMRDDRGLTALAQVMLTADHINKQAALDVVTLLRNKGARLDPDNTNDLEAVRWFATQVSREELQKYCPEVADKINHPGAGAKTEVDCADNLLLNPATFILNGFAVIQTSLSNAVKHISFATASTAKKSKQKFD